MNNHHYYISCFWKDGNNRTNLPIPNGGDGEVYDIAIEEDVYMLNEYKSSNI